jgi:choline dehydrogenase-like flavoprotein
MEHTKLPDHVDVVIVGMGPVGAALANLLGLQQTSVLVIDKATEIFAAPPRSRSTTKRCASCRCAVSKKASSTPSPFPR